MKKTILIACLGLVSLGLQAQSISLAGEWNVELGKSGSAFAKSKRASQGEVKRAILPGTIDTNHLGFAPKDTMEQVKAVFGNDSNYRILISNMEGNGWNAVVRTKFDQFMPLEDNDTVL